MAPFSRGRLGRRRLGSRLLGLGISRLGCLALLLRQAIALGRDLGEEPVEDRGPGWLGLSFLLLGGLGVLLAGGLRLRLGGLASLLLLLTTLHLSLGGLLMLFLEALALLFLGTGLLLRSVLRGVFPSLLATLLELGAELLANLVDVRVDERGRVILDGNLHLLEPLDELLGGHPELLGEFMYAHSCHVHYHLSPADAAPNALM